MKTRITQEEAYEFLRGLPEEITLKTYQEYQNKSLHLRLAPDKLHYTFTEEPLERTYHIKNMRLAYFYKGEGTKKRVPLGVGSMALWTTILQYMSQVEESQPDGYESVPFDVNQLRYIGTDDESEGVSSISSSMELPYRLTHTFLDNQDEVVLYIEDRYTNKRKTSCIYKQKSVKLNYLEEDRLAKQVTNMNQKESELSKAIKAEKAMYLDYYEDSEEYEA